MTTIRKIVTSKVDGDDANNTNLNEVRSFGETSFYLDTATQPNKLTLMIFDGLRTHLKSKVLAPGALYGSNADSGDGLNRDTIKLIPDATLHYNDSNYGNDQYLIIDPTAAPEGPEHIHIRAGGAINQSTADLFLGGEQNNVRVSDTNDRVTISTDAGEGRYNWTFDNNGDLSLPGSSNGRIADDEPGVIVYSNNGFAVQTNADANVSNYQVEFVGFISNGFGDAAGATLTVTEIVAGAITDGMVIYGGGLPEEGWTLTFGTVLTPQGSGGVGNYYLSGANYLTSSQSFNNGVAATNGPKNWIFGNDGSLTFPDATVQTTAFTATSYFSKFEVTTALDLKADLTALAAKADQIAVDSKADASALIGLATETYVDTAVGAINIPNDISDLTDTSGLIGSSLPDDGTGFLFNDGEGSLSWGYDGGSNALVVDAVKSSDFTLALIDNNKLLPVGSQVVVTIPAGLPSSYTTVLLQNDALPFTVQAGAGVTVRAPTGLTSVGQDTTMGLIQVSQDVWLVTITQAAASGSSNGGSMTLEPDNQAGTIVMGGNGATYVQQDGVVTVTWTAHGFNAAEHNGMNILLIRGTGELGFFNNAVNSWERFYFEKCRNFTYVNANTFTATTTNPVNTSGNLLAIADPAFNWPAASITIPANTLGKNGWFRTQAFLSHNGTAAQKHISTMWGPDNLYQNQASTFQMVSSPVTGANVYNSSDLQIHNQNNVAKQVLKEPMSPNGPFSSASGRPRRFTRDTAQNQRVTFAIRLASSSDWAILEYGLIEVFPKD